MRRRPAHGLFIRGREQSSRRLDPLVGEPATIGNQLGRGPSGQAANCPPYTTIVSQSPHQRYTVTVLDPLLFSACDCQAQTFTTLWVTVETVAGLEPNPSITFPTLQRRWTVVPVNAILPSLDTILATQLTVSLPICPPRPPRPPTLGVTILSNRPAPLECNGGNQHPAVRSCVGSRRVKHRFFQASLYQSVD